MSEEEVKGEPAYRLLREKKEVLQIIWTNSDDVKDCLSLQFAIQRIFAEEKAGICFSTIHKAKGLEADTVHIICPELMPSKMAKKDWQYVQEDNLIYVAYTRAKKTLNFVADFQYNRKEQERVAA
jgi:DNA helicase-2/ATP-dependent DNA helicase PcrA